MNTGNQTALGVATYIKTDAVMLALEAERAESKRNDMHREDTIKMLTQEVMMLRDKAKATEADVAKRDEELAFLNAKLAKLEAEGVKNTVSRAIKLDKLNIDNNDPGLAAIERFVATLHAIARKDGGQS